MTARLPSVSSREVCEALNRGGYTVSRTRGSHIIMRRGERRVSVPWGRRDVHPELLHLVLRDAGISKTEFGELLKGQG